MRQSVVLIAALLVAAAAVPVQADFIGATELDLAGPDTVRAPIDYEGQLASVLDLGAKQANTGQLFFEKSSVIAGSDLALTTGGTVSVGTTVRSYILHFDPIANNPSGVGTAWEIHATLTFEEAVLGVIFDTVTSHGNLAGTDATLGLGAGFYEDDWNHRKFETTQDKWNDVVIAGNTVTFNLFTTSSMDEARIVTTPVPGAVLLGLLGMSVAGWRLRRFA